MRSNHEYQLMLMYVFFFFGFAACNCFPLLQLVVSVHGWPFVCKCTLWIIVWTPRRLDIMFVLEYHSSHSSLDQGERYAQLRVAILKADYKWDMLACFIVFLLIQKYWFCMTIRCQDMVPCSHLLHCRSSWSLCFVVQATLSCHEVLLNAYVRTLNHRA